MKLLIILLALIAERFTDVNVYLKRFNCFQPYVNFLYSKLGTTAFWRGYLGVAVIILPALLLVGLVYCLLGHLIYGLVGFLIALFILIYCLGPRDLYAEVQKYFLVTTGSNTLEAHTHLINLLHKELPVDANPHRELTKYILWQFNQRVFAVIFWFLLLGPIGAVLYRMTTLIVEHAADDSSPEQPLLFSAMQLQNILDWLPARLLGIGYALVGDFSRSISTWMQYLLSGLSLNKELVENTGLAALKLADSIPGDALINENRDALALTDRTLIVYLVIVAVFVFGYLIY